MESKDVVGITKTAAIYYTCPACGFPDITGAFGRCMGCDATIKWKKQLKYVEVFK